MPANTQGYYTVNENPSPLRKLFIAHHKLLVRDAQFESTRKLVLLYQATRQKLDELIKAEKIRESGRMFIKKGSKYKNVIEAYDEIEKRDRQDKALKERMRDFQPQSWMQRNKERYGEIGGKRISDLEYADALRDIQDPTGAERVGLERRFGFKRGRALFKAKADKQFQYDMMDEYERTLSDLTERYGGDKAKAEASYANLLKKELPSFFKNSKLDSKTLFNISKGIGAIRGVPFLGKLATNPISAAIGAALLADKFLDKADTSNKSVVGWQNAVLLHGKPSDRYMNAALLAGETDPAKITQRLGKFALRYGTSEMAEKVYLYAAQMMANAKNPEMRRHIAASMEMDETDVAIAFAMAKSLPVSEQRKTAAISAKRDIAKTYGYSSGSGAGATFDALWYSIPFMNKLASRGISGKGIVAGGIIGGAFFEPIGSILGAKLLGIGLGNAEKSAIEKRIQEAYDTSVGDFAYQGSPNAHSVTPIHQGGDRSVSFAIGSINVNADDAAEFVDSMKSEAQMRGGREIVESFDPKGF